MIKINDLYGIRPKFYQVLPTSYGRQVNKIEISQSEIIAELEPSGHKINNPAYYENIFKEITRKDKDGVERLSIVEIPIERVSVPMQQVILTKQMTHACGNDVQFIYGGTENSEAHDKLLVELKQGWLKRNMETAKYEFVQSVKRTGDGAFCAVMENGKITWRVFTAYNNDELHPVFGFSKNLTEFGRSYSSYDYEKQEEVIYLERWDDKYFRRYRYATSNETAGADEDGWILEGKPQLHGFSRIPIVYVQNMYGACWTTVQHLIDKLELALSQLFENNKSYAFRIMVINGGFEIQGDLRGQARAILLDDPQAKAGFMEKADVSTSFELQLKQTLQFILMGSFTVLPPEVRSGDLPGVAIKILYSPAVEQAIRDKNFFNDSIDQIVNLFKEGYGIEQKQTLAYSSLDVRGEIIPYVHQNDSEIITNINTSVLDGTLSKKTASEKHPYASNDEFNRIQTEAREEMAASQDFPTNDLNLHNEQLAQTK